MAPNNYYQSYRANTQNSSNPQQTYPGYHAQTSMSDQPSGQYQTTGAPPAPSAPPTHDTYQGYQQQYAQQGTGYGSNQGFSWNTTYGANSGNSTAGSAAEALSSMSMADHSRAANAGYASGYNTSSGMSDRNIAALSQYTQGSSAAPQAHQTHAIQDTSRSSGTLHTTHAQRTSRPESVSPISSGYAAPTQRPAPPRLPTPGAPSAATSQHPARRVQAMSTEHRSPSPAQVRASHNAQRPAGSSLAAQYADLGSRRLPSVSETAYGNSSTAIHRQSYDRQTQNYEQSSVTVDPAHVYDPWQEKMRQAELARKAKEAEEAAAAARAAEDAERQKKAEEIRKAAEDARKAEEHHRMEAARKAEEERRASDTTQAQPGQKGKAKEDSVKGKHATDARAPSRKEAGPTATTTTPAPAAPAPASTAEDLEAQMRMIMANLREMNAKNPSLVAKIWEEERRASLAQESTRSPATQAAQPPSASAPQVAPRANMAAVRPGSIQNGMVNGHASGGRSITGPGYPPPQPRQEQYAPPQPVLAPAPTKPSSGGTVWPQEKKGELAAAAAKWLNEIPANANNKVSPADISRMLDSNPTYIDLCERLEGLGVQLERRTFAQALLKACPDVNNKSQIQKPPMPPGVRQLPPPGTAGGRPAPLTKQTAQPLHGLPTPHPTDDDMGPAPVDDPIYDAPPGPSPDAVQSPYFQPPPASATPGAVAPIATMISSTKRAQAMRTPSVKPVTKADAARKRDFSEIVDLTTLSDEELPPPPPKVPRTDPHGMLAFQPPPTAQQTTFINPNLRQLNFLPNGMPLQSHTAPQLVHPPPPVYDEFYNYTDLVKPIDRRKALRRSTYNLNTIARDVLLATGKHPEMRALNAHLEPLKLAFRQVEDRSDLDTFRWDIVDPGDPPPGYYSNGGAEAEEDADDEEDEPQPRARPRVMLQAGVGGGAATSRVADYNHDLAVAKAVFKKPRGRQPRHSDPGFVSRPPGPNTTDPAHHQRSSGQGGNNSSSGPGRPSPSNIGRDPHVTPAGRLPSASASAGAPPSQGTGVGYSALRVQEYGPDGSPLPKKRGRPVGWRKSIHGSAAAQAGTIRPGQGSGLRNVTEPGAGGASGAVVEIRSSNSPAMRQEVEYRVYKCRWQGCKAELHNLDTLRKHVFKLHGRPAAGGRWKCRWDGCGETVTVMDEVTGEENDEHRYLEFTDGEKWRGHIEAAHLGELAWRLGDGPAGGLSESHDSDAYLSDRSGRRVTPQIAAPSGASSSAPASAAHRTGPGRPAKKSDEQKALEAQRRLEQVKRDIGPGVDRGGARLANEKRRAGFVDDDVGEEVVDED